MSDLFAHASNSRAAARRPTPPHSLEAEESVVGGILLHAGSLNRVADFLGPDDFYHPALRAIYEAMLDLDQAGKPVDSITVGEQLKARDTIDKLRAFGGLDFLTELMGKVVTVENIEFHGRIVRGKATARRLVSACGEIAARGYGEYGDVDTFIDEAERAIFEVAQRAERSTFEHAKPLVKKAVAAIGERYQRRDVVTGVATEWTRFDELTSGLQPGDLIVVGARPSMGKTSWALQAAMRAGFRGVPALIFSLEMSKLSLVERMIACEARIDSSKLRRGTLDQRDWVQLTKAATAIAKAPIYIDDTSAPTLLELRAKARRWRSDKRIFTDKTPTFSGSDKPQGLIVIDYLQLVQGRASKDDNRQREVADISRGLKSLAKDLGVPIVALSQLNRSLESREDKRPRMSDLRESGAVEQDADVICFLYREEYYAKEMTPAELQGVAEVIVAKQRNGATGTVPLAFLNVYTRFENLSSTRELF
jgi:replicative DNA helicase